MSAINIVELFSKVPEHLEYEAGQQIFVEGEIGNWMYGIIEGTVEMQVDGKTVETLEQGDIFGEGALVHPDGKRRSTAVAKTQCKLAALDEERFKFLIENTPTFALDVMRSYSNRLQFFKHPKFG